LGAQGFAGFHFDTPCLGLTSDLQPMTRVSHNPVNLSSTF
jgi:hypothetical protein